MSIHSSRPFPAAYSGLVAQSGAQSALAVVVVATLFGLLGPTRAWAQERPDRPRGLEGGRDPREMMKRADTNGDGKVSKAEFIAARTAEMEEVFARIDANGDGGVDEDEATRFGERLREFAGRAGGGPGGEGRRGEGAGPRPPRSPSEEEGRRGTDPEGGMAEQFFQRADADGDGKLSREEFRVASERLRELMGRRGGAGVIGGRATPPEEGFRKPPARPEGT